MPLLSILFLINFKTAEELFAKSIVNGTSFIEQVPLII